MEQNGKDSPKDVIEKAIKSCKFIMLVNRLFIEMPFTFIC